MHSTTMGMMPRGAAMDTRDMSSPAGIACLTDEAVATSINLAKSTEMLDQIEQALFGPEPAQVRDKVLIEQNPAYCDIARRRVAETGLFAGMT